MSGLVLPALMANRFDIMELNPGARQDWAINPSLNSASDNNMMDPSLTIKGCVRVCVCL